MLLLTIAYLAAIRLAWTGRRGEKMRRAAPGGSALSHVAPPMPNSDELTKAKEPFLLRDYVSSFEGATRNMNAINTIRGWQVAAVGGLTAFTKSLPWYVALVVVLFAWLALLLLECNEQLFLQTANDHIEECEKRLHAATTVEGWRATVRDWTFGGQEAHKAARDNRWWTAFMLLRKNGVWPWQILVLAALIGGLLLRPYLPAPGKL